MSVRRLLSNNPHGRRCRRRRECNRRGHIPVLIVVFHAAVVRVWIVMNQCGFVWRGRFAGWRCGAWLARRCDGVGLHVGWTKRRRLVVSVIGAGGGALWQDRHRRLVADAPEPDG